MKFSIKLLAISTCSGWAKRGGNCTTVLVDVAFTKRLVTVQKLLQGRYLCITQHWVVQVLVWVQVLKKDSSLIWVQ